MRIFKRIRGLNKLLGCFDQEGILMRAHFIFMFMHGSLGQNALPKSSRDFGG